MTTRSRTAFRMSAAFLFAFLLPGLPRAVRAVTFTVTTTADANDANPGDGICRSPGPSGACTLRAAIDEANADADDDKILFPPGTYKLTLGMLVITTNVTLQGLGPGRPVIDADGKSRVLEFGTDLFTAIVHLDNVAVINGRTTGPDPGGGIRIRAGGNGILSNCEVRNNTSDVLGAGIRNLGIYVIRRCTIRDNTITGSTSGGGVTAVGGGISNGSRTSLQIFDSTISGNQATRGGGIDNTGRLQITNSTISGNRAFGGGGGLRNRAVVDQAGNPIVGSGLLLIAASTITANQANLGAANDLAATRTGGGISNGGGGGRVFMSGSIVAGNSDNRSTSDPNHSPDCSSRTGQPDTIGNGTFSSERGNVIGVVNGNCNIQDELVAGLPFDLVGTPAAPLDPKLDPLADNGGPTLTHAPQFDSPAIDNGVTIPESTFFLCPGSDQRGAFRPRDGDDDGIPECESGAVEFGGAAPFIITTSFSMDSDPETSTTLDPTPDGPAGTFFIRATFRNTGAEAVRKPFFQVQELSGGNLLLNADGGVGGTGSILTPDVGDDGMVEPGETFSTEFRIGLQSRRRFTFFVDIFGEPTSP